MRVAEHESESLDANPKRWGIDTVYGEISEKVVNINDHVATNFFRGNFPLLLQTLKAGCNGNALVVWIYVALSRKQLENE